MKIKISLIFILVLVIIFSITGCPKYVLYLPSKERQVIKIEEGEPYPTTNIFNELNNTATNPKNINIIIMNGPEAGAARELASEFEKLYGIKATIYDAPWNEIKKNIATPLSGIASDVFPIDVVVFPGYYLGEMQRYLRDLDDSIKKDDIDLEDFLPGIFNLVSDWKGSIKALPIQYSVNCVIFRSDIFSKNNLTVKKDWNYEEYYDYMKKLTNNNEFGILFDPLKLNVYWLNRFVNLGGKTATEDWDVTVNNEIGYKSVDMLKSLLNFAPDNILKESHNDIILDFINGNSAMVEDFPDFLFTNQEIINSENYNNIGILPMPKGSGGNYTILESKLIGFTKNSDKSEMAWEWIKYYTSKEKSALLLDKYGILPARISAYENVELNDKYKFLIDIYKLLKDSDVKTRWKIQGSYEIFEVMINNKLYSSLVENKPSTDTMKEIEDEWEKNLEFMPPNPDIKNIE